LTPYSVVVWHQHFGWPCCPHLQGEVNIEAIRSSKTMVSYHNTTQHMKTEEPTSFRMLVSYHNTTWCHNP